MLGQGLGLRGEGKCDASRFRYNFKISKILKIVNVLGVGFDYCKNLLLSLQIKYNSPDCDTVSYCGIGMRSSPTTVPAYALISSTATNWLER